MHSEYEMHPSMVQLLQKQNKLSFVAVSSVSRFCKADMSFRALLRDAMARS